MCCNNCNRGPQGIQGLNSVINVLTQLNTSVNSPIDDAGDEAFLMSNANTLVYLATSEGRYRVSLQFKLNNTDAGSNHTVVIRTGVATGLQSFPIGTALVYLALSPTYNVNPSSVYYDVFEFDVFLAANESIALGISTSASGDVYLQDNIFLIDKIV